MATRLAYNFAGWPTKIAGDTPTVSAPGFFTYTRREPVGVVGMVIPWNYPLIHTIQKIMPALACGNTVILKPSEKASLVTIRLAELFAEADLPPGVVNIVTGDGATGAAMSAHPGIDKMAFTGSVAAGRAVMRAAADTTKRVSLELGNKGGEHRVRRRRSRCRHTTQLRGRVRQHGSELRRRLAPVRPRRRSSTASVTGLIELAEGARIGHALDPETTLGPIVDQIQLDSILGYIARGGDEGATLSHGGRHLTEGPLGDGFYVEPTIFDGVDDSMTIACEEIFGPVVTIHPFHDEDEVVGPGQRHPLRSGRCGVDQLRGPGSPDGGRPRHRCRLGQHLRHVRPGDALRGPQGQRLRSRQRQRGDRHVHRAEVGVGEHDMINPFTFHLPTKLVWHTPASEAVAEEIKALEGWRTLIVTDPGVAGAGLLDPLTAALEDALVDVAVYSDVTGNPTTADVAAARSLAEQFDAAAIVALGGGSAIDTAKATAMLMTNPGEYHEYQWEGRTIIERSLPFVAVPTTAGTGSEVSKVAVISDESQPFKKGVLSPLMFAHVAVIDPELTVGLPAPITAATGIDAFVHALEAYTGRRTNPVSDTLALRSLELCVNHLQRATDDGSDLDARSGMMLAAVFGGAAMDQSGLGLVHALSGGICSHLHLHHGLANALILPYAAGFNAGHIAPDRQARLNEVFGLPGDAPDTALVESLTELVRSLGLPVGLGDRRDEIDGTDWDAVVDESMRMVMIQNNPRAVTTDDCRALIEAMR